MSKFKKFAREDRTLAMTGVWFEAYDNVSNYLGKFQLRYGTAGHDPFSQAGQLAAKRARQALGIRDTKDDNVAMINLAKIMVENNLVDWADVMGANDKPVPFDKKDALEFLSDEDNRELLLSMSSFCGDAKNYLPLTTEEITKNS